MFANRAYNDFSSTDAITFKNQLNTRPTNNGICASKKQTLNTTNNHQSSYMLSRMHLVTAIKILSFPSNIFPLKLFTSRLSWRVSYTKEYGHLTHPTRTIAPTYNLSFILKGKSAVQIILPIIKHIKCKYNEYIKTTAIHGTSIIYLYDVQRILHSIVLVNLYLFPIFSPSNPIDLQSHALISLEAVTEGQDFELACAWAHSYKWFTGSKITAASFLSRLPHIIHSTAWVHSWQHPRKQNWRQPASHNLCQKICWIFNKKKSRDELTRKREHQKL